MDESESISVPIILKLPEYLVGNEYLRVFEYFAVIDISIPPRILFHHFQVLSEMIFFGFVVSNFRTIRNSVSTVFHQIFVNFNDQLRQFWVFPLAKLREQFDVFSVSQSTSGNCSLWSRMNELSLSRKKILEKLYLLQNHRNPACSVENAKIYPAVKKFDRLHCEITAEIGHRAVRTFCGALVFLFFNLLLSSSTYFFFGAHPECTKFNRKRITTCYC